MISCGSGGGIVGAAHFDGQGHLKTGDPNVVRATHRMFGRHGDIDIKFEGQYGPITHVGTRSLAFADKGHWQITCGTGAYAGIQRQGTATAVADFTDAFSGVGPVTVHHVDTGDMHFIEGAGGVC